MGLMFWPLVKDFACGRAKTSSVPGAPSFNGNGRVDIKDGGRNVRFPCPLALLLPSTHVAPAAPAMLAEGAIGFGSWAVVMSKSVVITIQDTARND